MGRKNLLAGWGKPKERCDSHWWDSPLDTVMEWWSRTAKVTHTCIMLHTYAWKYESGLFFSPWILDSLIMPPHARRKVRTRYLCTTCIHAQAYGAGSYACKLSTPYNINKRERVHLNGSKILKYEQMFMEKVPCDFCTISCLTFFSTILCNSFVIVRHVLKANV